jgi:uncharacterized protein (DUF305 family)
VWIIGKIQIFTVAATFLAAPALAQQPEPTQNMDGMSMSDAAGSAADKAMMDGMSKMQQDMVSAPMIGDPDQDFVAMMLPHHEGAVDMAKVELKYGKDPEMLKLAQDIVASQSRERAEMTAWQAKRAAK